MERPRPLLLGGLEPPLPAPSPIDVFTRAVRERLEDQEITDAEGDELKALAADLGLSDQDWRSIFAVEARKEINARVADAIADGQFSPDEEADAVAFAHKIGIKLTGIEGEPIEAAREAWRAQNGPLPSLNSPLGLRRGEVAHMVGRAEATEDRTRTRAVSYGGPSVSIPIMAGVRFRMGHIAVTRHAEDYRHSFGVGDLVATNQRLLFVSSERPLTSLWTSVLSGEPFIDGFRVTRTSGKPQLYLYQDNPRVAMIVVRAWNIARAA